MISKVLVVLALVCAVLAGFGLKVLGLSGVEELAVGLGALAVAALI